MPKKRGYYIVHDSDISTEVYVGVAKKIERHIQVMNQELNVQLIAISKETSIFRHYLSVLPFVSAPWKYEEAFTKINDPDFLYIRRFRVDLRFIGFLRTLRNTYPKCKIIIEIYTYPYDVDDFFRSLRQFITTFPFYIKDRLYRNFQSNYIDRFVTYSQDDEIFNVPTIKTINGIQVDNIVPITPQKKDDDQSINLISVANMQPQHGYERIIRGLADYYKKSNVRRVNFLIVGDGEEVKYYKKLVKKLKLENRVHFYGRMIGHELDGIYNRGNIGVCSFGMYKFKLNYASSLKIPEYLAKGLPIISGCKIRTINNEPIKYCLEFPNDNSNIDINKIISFYDSLVFNDNRTKLFHDIREYAKRNFDEKLAIKPIINFIEENNNFVNNKSSII